MRRINALLVLVLIAWPTWSVGQDKKEPRSLAEEAAYLSEQSGKNGWVSGEVTVSREDGNKKAKGKLLMHFTADKGKPTGSLRLAIDHGRSQVGGVGIRFELVEKDGKRSIKILAAGVGPKENPDPKLVATLEYTLKSDQMTVKDGVIRQTWAGWDVDLTEVIAFKAAGK